MKLMDFFKQTRYGENVQNSILNISINRMCMVIDSPTIMKATEWHNSSLTFDCLPENNLSRIVKSTLFGRDNIL